MIDMKKKRIIGGIIIFLRLKKVFLSRSKTNNLHINGMIVSINLVYRTHGNDYVNLNQQIFFQFYNKLLTANCNPEFGIAFAGGL